MNWIFDRIDPAQREQVATIDWKHEHYRDNARGNVFAALEEQRDQAARSGLTPYYIRPMQGSELPVHQAPFAVRPVWNAERRMLELSFLSARHPVDENTPETARFQVPPHIYAKALQHHRESVLESLKAQFSGTAPGGAIRARAVGGECIRDYLREKNVEISLSFGIGLFNAITQLDNSASAN